MEPCGCASGQLGGLSRRHSFLENFLKDHPHTLLLSTGNLTQGLTRQDRLKFQTILQAMNEMHYDVMGLGKEDLFLGFDDLQEMGPSCDFPMLASNLKNSPFEKLYSKKWMDEKRRVQIVSVIEKNFENTVQQIDPRKALYQFFQNHLAPNIFWMLIYHGQMKDAVELVKAFPQIKLGVVANALDEPPREVVHVGDSILTSVPVGGKYVGEIYFELNESNNLVFDRMAWTPLDEKWEMSEKIQQILEDYQSFLQNERLDQKMEGRLTSKASFLGSQACKGCHLEAFKVWQGSRHAKAFQSLIKKKRSFDPDCLVCHSIGFKYKSGFQGVDKTLGFAQVGCESCHGAGSMHVASPTLCSMEKPLENKCQTCHDPENSPHFDFAKYWEKIRH